jgi:hypothetical protein
MTSSERTRERSHYAARRRRDLIDVLAPDGRCAECDDQVGSDQLEVDHVNGREWMIENVSASVRYARYWREFESDVPMRALCKPCNGSTGGARRYERKRA